MPPPCGKELAEPGRRQQLGFEGDYHKRGRPRDTHRDAGFTRFTRIALKSLRALRWKMRIAG
jgi:hypothetical protein